ncbi:sensor histidine kinase [Cohnella abietis]|uniref:Putative two-component sensor kinase n=1 Tax=Cohnella abietis TaxID=2507935 RepID=A0A3T1D1I7_9BACL|nr:sensor histidine kinase [Cohnella abietis]BBI31918.1 putative two-component sensor kinase [Cohnella abietis]
MKLFKRLRIKTQLLIIALSTLTVMIFIIFFNYFKVADVVTVKNDESTAEMLFQLQQAQNSDFDVLNRVLTNVAYNKLVQQYLTVSDELNKFELFQQLNNFIVNMMEMKEGILDIILIGSNGTSISYNGSSTFANAYIKDIPSNNVPYYLGVKKYKNYNSLIVGTKVYWLVDAKEYYKEIGTLFLVVDVKAISNKFNPRSNQNGTSLYLLDRDNYVFSTNTSLEVGSKFQLLPPELIKEVGKFDTKIDGEEVTVQIQPISQMSGKMINVIPRDFLLSDVAKIRRQELYIFLIAMFLLAIPLIYITNNILHPLKKLMSFMSLLKNGSIKNLKNRIALEGYAEMTVVAVEFNTMLNEIDNLAGKLLETNSRYYLLELEKKQAEFAYLKSQINPHFLYNTLESIKGIASVRGVAEIHDMTQSLGQIFQYSIKGEDKVALREELTIVECYLQIQQIRFMNKFIVHMKISDQASACIIPKMILQPIVENAIYHGLEPKLGKGNLWISAEVTDTNHLVISVKENGVGIESQALANLEARLGQAQDQILTDKKAGIGMVNVDKRIKLVCGDHFGLKIHSIAEEGTEVILSLPAWRADHV